MEVGNKERNFIDKNIKISRKFISRTNISRTEFILISIEKYKCGWNNMCHPIQCKMEAIDTFCKRLNNCM